MTIRCPAKVNTFLSVGPPDASGYHPIRTEFQAIGIWDDLHIKIGEGTFECVDMEVPTDNTVTKALRLLREALPIPPLDVRLVKNVPSQAGLGGGSSDAAGLVRFVKKTWPDMLEDHFAQEVAIAVGADVPFFLVGGRARATGYGERLEPLPDLDRRWLLVAQPECRVSTAQAYAKLDESPREFTEFQDAPYNDFERVAPCECLDLIEQIALLGGRRTMLSGSGSAVFGEFPTEESALIAAGQIRNAATWVAPTLTREESLWTS